MKPFRYGIVAKLVIGAFLSFFFLLRVEGTCFTESCQLSSCSVPESTTTQNDGMFKISMDIPGVQPQDLDVSVDGNTVRLIGNRMDDAGDLVSCYQKSWQLDSTVDLDSLVMEHNNGVLTVSAPKAETKPIKRPALVRGTKFYHKPNQRATPMYLDRSEPPLGVDPISYDEPELLESVSVLKDEGQEIWM